MKSELNVRHLKNADTLCECVPASYLQYIPVLHWTKIFICLSKKVTVGGAVSSMRVLWQDMNFKGKWVIKYYLLNLSKPQQHLFYMASSLLSEFVD